MTDHDTITPTTPTYDVAVVGGGIAGLSAAIEAAGSGRRVVLFDARDSIGGRARTQTRDGYRLNEGAHALYLSGAAMAFLTELGCPPPGATPDAGAGIGVDGVREGRFPTTAWALLRTPLLRGDRFAMGKLFARLPRMNPADFADRTVDDAITDLLGSGRSAQLGRALFRLSTYANDPADTSADAGIDQLQMSLDGGVRYLDHGWQTMVDDLTRLACDRDVAIRTGAKVESVTPAGDGYRVSAGHETVLTTSVIVAGSPALAATLLGDHAPICRTWADVARPAAVASLDVGIAADWGEHRPFALGIDTPTYLSVHAPVADLAPEGHTLVHVMRYLPSTEARDAERDRAECEALLDRVRPDWRTVADHVAFRPHLVAATDQPSAATGGMAGRPPVMVPGTEGLFVAGDWVGPTGMLVDASVASGRAAGRLAARARIRSQTTAGARA